MSEFYDFRLFSVPVLSIINLQYSLKVKYVDP